MKQGIIKILKIIKRSFFFKPWSTKPLELWAILNLILIKTKPESILELGSGRSTFHFYEYAIKYNKNLESVEHNWTYLKFIQKGLKSVFGKNYNYMNFVPIKNDWYDSSKIKTDFDFLFIDGPNENSFLKTNNSTRSSKKAVEFLRDKIKNCKIVIIDDTDRALIVDLINNLNIKLKYNEFIYNNNQKINNKPAKLRIYYQIQYEEFVDNISKLILQETDPKILTT
jgi:hypothetical protein